MDKVYVTSTDVRECMEVKYEKFYGSDNYIVARFILFSDRERREKESLFCNSYTYEAVFSPRVDDLSNEDTVWVYWVWSHPVNEYTEIDYKSGDSEEGALVIDEKNHIQSAINDVVQEIYRDVNKRIFEDVEYYKEKSRVDNVIDREMGKAIEYIDAVNSRNEREQG